MAPGPPHREKFFLKWEHTSRLPRVRGTFLEGSDRPGAGDFSTATESNVRELLDVNGAVMMPGRRIGPPRAP